MPCPLLWGQLNPLPRTFEDGFPGEIPAIIRSCKRPSKRRGSLLVAYIGLLLLISTQFAVVIFVRSDFLLSIIGAVYIVVLFYLFYEMWNRRSDVDPALAWLGPRSIQVWVKLDGEDFVVRLPGKRELYQPSKLEWVNDTSFNLSEEGVTFQLVFRSLDDASKVAEMIKTKFSVSSTA